MFVFKKFKVYEKIHSVVPELYAIANNHGLDKVIAYQLKRASLSMLLNTAEGSGRKTKKDRRHFFVIARGSCFECAAILHLLEELDSKHNWNIKALSSKLDDISAMLYAITRD